MNFYQEITLDSTNSLYKLWSKLYYEMHKIFFDFQKNNIGISFPEYYFNEDKQIGFLGSKLRIFSMNEENLTDIKLEDKLSSLKKDLCISSVLAVPCDVLQYSFYSRFQCKTSAERLARHRIKTKNDMEYDQAVNHYKSKLKKSNLPYISLKSSKGYDFKLFIRKIPAEKTDILQFNSYGLSKKSSVPEF